MGATKASTTDAERRDRHGAEGPTAMTELQRKRAGAAAPGSGWRDDTDGVHVFPIRVYYEDTDALGIVYYVNYLKFAERARTEMLRRLGHGQADLIDQQGIGFTVRRCEVDFLAPARLDDALEVHTRLTDLKGASLNLEQTVKRDGADLARLKLKIACVDTAGRATSVPDTIRNLFEPLARRDANVTG
jgi:acyl-CoA thioester hydrolase